jgi:hypothetical protein
VSEVIDFLEDEGEALAFGAVEFFAGVDGLTVVAAVVLGVAFGVAFDVTLGGVGAAGIAGLTSLMKPSLMRTCCSMATF